MNFILGLWRDSKFLFLFTCGLISCIGFLVLVGVSINIGEEEMRDEIKEMSCGELKGWILEENRFTEFAKDRYVWMCEKLPLTYHTREKPGV